MGTRVSRPDGRLLSHVAFLGMAALLVAGCSENSSRFDSLFTSSVAQPQRIDHNARSSAADNIRLGRADLGDPAPQRLDAPGRSDNSGRLFNARNVTRLSSKNGFRSSPRPVVFANPGEQEQFGSQGVGRSSFGAPATTQRPSSVSRQSLPPVQSAPSKSTFATPNSAHNSTGGGRLTLEEARALNDVEERLPQHEQKVALSTPQAFEPASSPGQFNTGTEWTRRYSPVPTSAPVAKTPSAGGPRGYTPPQGGPESGVDRFPTSSIARPAQSAPRIIRALIGGGSYDLARADNGVDPTTVTSVARASSGSAAKGGWSSAGGTYIAVQEGETLYSLSRRYGVPVSALAAANGIDNPASVGAGQQILIPTYVYSPDAPVSAPDATQRLAAGVSQNGNASSSGIHIVEKGDTLSRIAAKNNISLARLKAANNLENGDVIRIGQKLRIDGTGGQSSLAEAPRENKTVAVNAAAASAPVATRLPVQKTSRVELPRLDRASPASQAGINPARAEIKPVASTKEKAEPAIAAAKSYTPPKADPVVVSAVKAGADEEKSAAAKADFIWPVQGEVVSKFGANQNGGRNDGIDLNVAKGTPVRAAASGEVIYASNGLADYGNLVLVRHANGFVTAYAHNSELLVSRGQRVGQGQVVAKSGDTGSVSRAQVHFEIREGKKPVNPLDYLPG